MLGQFPVSETLLQLKDMTNFLQRLSELELDYLRVLTISEITSRESEDGMSSQNHDEEKARWP